MLATCLTSSWLLIFQHTCLTAAFFFLLRQKQASFIQVWYLLFYFLLQSVSLGFLGEDFFVVFALAAELPVFLGFFFFYVAKSQLGSTIVLAHNARRKTKYLLAVFLTSFLLIKQDLLETKTFTYSLYVDVLHTPQKSDFFIFFYYYYLLNGTVIVFVGILITLVTVILVLLAFKNQVTNNASVTQAKQLQWVRTQSTSTQSSQRSGAVFFKL